MRVPSNTFNIRNEYEMKVLRGDNLKTYIRKRLIFRYPKRNTIFIKNIGPNEWIYQ